MLSGTQCLSCSFFKKIATNFNLLLVVILNLLFSKIFCQLKLTSFFHNRRVVNLGGEFLLLMLYREEERIRRDSTKWTLVQGVLAPLQFVVFLVSLGFVFNYLLYGTYESAASVSVVMKTFILCLIMVTGSIWEKAVFDKYLFAKPFYWEDVVSIVVVFLHLLYLFVYFFDFLSVESQLYVALLAYFAYVVNAVQFLFKFKQARDQNLKSLSSEVLS